uniref:DUF148 domain-containing protein n=1 Tax=Strongyloides papillosus TaxID=174720 RepID=A0A0N5CE57_STREA
MFFKYILYIFLLFSYFFTTLCAEQGNENFQKDETVVDEIAEIEKTVNAINSVPLEEKFNESKENIINILKTNESPLDKINHINQMMNKTNFTEDEQIQFYNTLSDAIMSSKNN